ncbi:MAG: hypothetical protein SGJ11_14625 [Phycisphaerae bacterium]|nr:hypothetical protein [Phycisphaerae bacterium]
MTRHAHAFVLAWHHLVYHRGRTIILIVAIALAAALPLLVRSLVAAGSDTMMARARSTPLAIGSRGSELDLVVASLYFARPAPRSYGAGELTRLADSTSGTVVPLHLGFSAQRQPIVGTSLDYFELRALRLKDGRQFAVLGECVLGFRAAQRLTLPIISDALDPYDLAGTIPLKLNVTGTLAPSGTADDDAIFVDLKTAWTIAGIGHGHQDAGAIRDPNDLIGTVGDHVVASERLRHYEEITPELAATFHFHGDPATFPIHAMLVWPRDARDAALLQGRFQRSDEPLQIVRPTDAIERLLREILRLKRFLDAIFIAVGAVTMAVVALVIALSVRLRRDELTTMVRLGAARGTVFHLIAAELVLIAVVAGAVVAISVAASASLGGVVEQLIVSR